MDEYKFNPGDFGNEEDEEETDAPMNNQTSLDWGKIFDIKGLLLLPVTAFAVYTFVEEAAAIAALTALFGGATMAATVVGTALWIVGAVTVGLIGVAAALTIISFIAGIVKFEPTLIGLGILGAIYFGVGIGGALYVFSALPLAVGFILSTISVMWAGFIVFGFLGTLIATASM